MACKNKGWGGLKENELDATLKYVMHDMPSELFVELMAGFHKPPASVQQGWEVKTSRLRWVTGALSVVLLQMSDDLWPCGAVLKLQGLETYVGRALPQVYMSMPADATL
jgi:hypothetical protein